MPIITGSSGSKNVADLMDEVRRRLHGSHTGAVLNVLDGDHAEDVTTITVEDTPAGVKSGTIIEIEYEQMYVRSVDDNDLTVLRGHNGTTAAAHSSGEIVRVSPSYYGLDIFHAIQDEFASLNGTGLVQFHTVELTHTSTGYLYDSELPTTTEHLFLSKAVWQQSSTYEKWRPLRAELMKDMDTDDFPSGSAIAIPHHPSGMGASATVRATMATTFTRPTSPSSTVSEAALGTSDSVVPIVTVGAAWRLILGKEAQRINPDWASGSRRAEETPAGSIAFLGRALQSQREDLIEGALQRQYQLHPPRRDIWT